MLNATEKTEALIRRALASMKIKRHFLAEALSDMPDFPITYFPMIKEKIWDETADILLRKPHGFRIFKLMATQTHVLRYFLGLFLAVGAFLEAFFLNSWMVGLGVVFAVLGFKCSKRVIDVALWPMLAYAIALVFSNIFTIDPRLFVSLAFFAAIGGYLVRDTYTSAIISGAMQSEIAFSFLFSSGEIAFAFEKGIFVMAEDGKIRSAKPWGDNLWESQVHS